MRVGRGPPVVLKIFLQVRRPVSARTKPRSSAVAKSTRKAQARLVVDFRTISFEGRFQIVEEPAIWTDFHRGQLSD